MIVEYLSEEEYVHFMQSLAKLKGLPVDFGVNDIKLVVDVKTSSPRQTNIPRKIERAIGIQELMNKKNKTHFRGISGKVIETSSDLINHSYPLLKDISGTVDTKQKLKQPQPKSTSKSKPKKKEEEVVVETPSSVETKSTETEVPETEVPDINIESN